MMSGQIVMISGASRGIGAATAKVFAKAGARVALLARSEEAITSLADEIGDAALAIPCDVGDYASVEQAVTRCREHFGGLDVLINNAGVIEPIARISDADPKAWAQAIDINLTGVFNGMRAVMPGMIANGSGTILTISSGAAHHPLEGWSHYCSSKAGAAMLTRCADQEVRAAGLRIMGLSPGTVATQMQREIKASGVNPVAQLEWSDHIPPEWPAQALLWMCGAEADPWLGQEISLRDDAIRSRIGLA